MEEILITAGFAFVLCAFEIAVARWVHTRYVSTEGFETLRDVVAALANKVASIESVVGSDRETPLPDRVARLEGAVEDVSRYDLGTLRERVTMLEAQIQKIETEADDDE